MHRRKLFKLTATCCALSTLPGCDRGSSVAKNRPISLPPFSASRLHAALERLRQAYEAKDMPVSGSLLPPLDEQTLRARTRWFPGDLPPELIALYGWHEGQARGAWEEEHPFWFRDNAFVNLDLAEQAYGHIMGSYGLNPFDRNLLKYSFPFATLEGAWYVLPTRGHPFNPDLPMPVVSVFDGVDVFYYSIEAMVNTCVDWVSHESYGGDYGLPSKTELAIWRKHNPGIFTYSQ